jgi:TolA-binding protein
MATSVEPTQSTADLPTSIETGEAPLLNPTVLRRAMIAGGVVLAIGAGAWVAISSGKRKETFAAQQLSAARDLAESGNVPAASAEFQKIITTYAGTAAAGEAVIALNQLRLVNGQSALAIEDLQKFIGSSPKADALAAANGLLGAALENTGKPAEAAEAYKAAAAAATAEFLKTEQMLNQARALRTAGKTAEAETVLRDVVANHPKSPSFTEAQVRLSELTRGKM